MKIFEGEMLIRTFPTALYLNILQNHPKIENYRQKYHRSRRRISVKSIISHHRVLPSHHFTCINLVLTRRHIPAETWLCLTQLSREQCCHHHLFLIIHHTILVPNPLTIYSPSFSNNNPSFNHLFTRFF